MTAAASPLRDNDSCSWPAHVPGTRCEHPPICCMLQLTQHMAEDFYAEHKGKPFYPGLVEFMTSGPIFALVLAKAGAIKAWRELMGPTDVFEARVRAPKR